MTTLTEIPRLTDLDKAPNAPGWYAIIGPVRVDTQCPTRLKPIIRCNCGELMGIGDHHVHADGRVTASFYDRNGCGWHVYLKLLDYDQGEFPPEGKPLPQAGTK